MSDVNVVVLGGRLTKAPEQRFTPSGTPVCNFTLASNRQYIQGEEKKEETVFLEVSVFGKLAEQIAKHLEQGQAVTVNGRLQQRRWQDREQQPQTRTEIVATEVIFGPKAKPKPDEENRERF